MPKIIDLSVILNNSTPVYPGDPSTRLETITTVENDGHLDHYLSTVTHTGTHIDAPAHMLAGGKGLSDFPIDHFIGRGVYIRVENNRFDLEAVKAVDIRKDDIVMFHTGMSDHYSEDTYWENRPVMSEEIAHYLAAAKIKMVGLDTGSADAKGTGNHPVHKILLAADVLIIENLSNLASLADADFTVYALPLKLETDGAPARVIARLQ
jgi:arylformamidase